MKLQRLLFIHAGGGKAGSSAIQSALAEAASHLTALGIAYANAPYAQTHYAITSGNGLALYDLIASPRWGKEGADLLESYLGTHAIGICSSEFLGNMSTGDWRKLLETAAECGIEVRVLFFVRPAGSYLAACYNQDVKRGGVHASLDEYLVDASWHHLDALMTLDAVFPADALRVLNYEASRSDVAGAFANAFPELAPTAKLLRSATNRTVNRSLDRAEIAIVRRINEQLGGKAGEALSDRMIYAMPEKRGGIGMEEAQAETIAAKYADGSSWINERFFAGGARALRLNSGMEASTRSEIEAELQTLALALDWSIEQFGTQPSDNADAIRQAFFNIDWENAELADIPADFDPFAYLIFNPDVVTARIPPFIHYQSSGKHEHRMYNWSQRGAAPRDAEIAEAVAKLRGAHGPEQTIDPLRRLRYQYQVESLLHAFATREREYLDEIRRLGERRGFDRAEIRQEFTKLSQTVADALVSNREETTAAVSGALERLGASVSQAQSLADRSARATASQNAEAVAELEKATISASRAMMQELEALRAQQASLNLGLAARDAEMQQQRNTIRRYREAGLLDILRWAIQRSKRP